MKGLKSGAADAARAICQIGKVSGVEEFTANLTNSGLQFLA